MNENYLKKITSFKGTKSLLDDFIANKLGFYKGHRNQDFGDFPNSLKELVNNRIQLNRMLGLSNLYYIDPEDEEILKELESYDIKID